MISYAYFKLQSQVNNNSIFILLMTEVFDILLDPYHWRQILCTKLQIRLQKPRIQKQFSTNFWKNGEIRSTEVENGPWQQDPLYLVSFSRRVILFTIPMSQIIVGNGNCKRKCLKQICGKGGISNKISKLSFISFKKDVCKKTFFKLLRYETEDFSAKIRK